MYLGLLSTYFLLQHPSSYYTRTRVKCFYIDLSLLFWDICVKQCKEYLQLSCTNVTRNIKLSTGHSVLLL